MDVSDLWTPGKGRFYRPDASGRWADDRSILLLNLPEWQVPRNPDWAEDPYGHYSWRVQYHTLNWIFAPLKEYDRTGDESFLRNVKSLVFDWIETNLRTPPDRGAAWNDFSTAHRAAALTYVYHEYLAALLTPSEDRLYLTAIHEHADRLLTLLSNPIYIGHNHGVMHGLALLDIGTAFPSLKAAASWTDASVERLNSLFDEMVFPSDGVSVEQAFGYQTYVMQLFFQTNGTLKALDYPGLEGFSARISDMIEFAYISMLPSERLAAIGDTRYLGDPQLSYLKALVRKGYTTPQVDFLESGGREGERPPELSIYREAGFAVFRPNYPGDPEYASNDLRMIFDFTPAKRSHGHDDALSFVLDARGASLIVDSGGPYLAGDPFRTEYFTSSRAHNTILVDGEGSSGPSALVRHGGGTAWSFVTASQTNTPGVRHERTLMLLKSDFILVFDALTSKSLPNNGQHRYDLLFHLAPDAAITRDDFIHVASGGAGLTLQTLGSDLGALRIPKGDRGAEPQGWVTPDLGEAVAAPVLQQTGTGRNAWFASLLMPHDGGAAEPFIFAAVEDGDGLRVFAGDEGVRWSAGLSRAAPEVVRLAIGRDDDTWFGGSGPNAFSGGAGADWISGLGGADWLEGGGGNDLLLGGRGADRLLPGAGSDIADGGAGRDKVLYSDAVGPMAIDLEAGIARARGGGQDVLLRVEDAAGSRHDDDLMGSWRSNSLSGEGGDDFLNGRGGDDRLAGGDGADVLVGGAGADEMRGGRGYDRYVIDGGGDRVIEPSGGGEDLVDARYLRGGIVCDLREDVLFFDGGRMPVANIERVTGSGARDDIRGDDATNVLRGMSGDDFLFGRGGKDWLNGGDGSDLIWGGRGPDMLNGGEGNDRFAYLGLYEAGDTILDFSVGRDLLDLGRLLDRQTDAGGDPFASGHVRAVSVGGGTTILIDIDGDRGPAGDQALLWLDGIDAHALTGDSFLF